MKKWIIGSIILVVLAISLTIFTYVQIVDSNRAGFDEAAQTATSEANLTEVIEVSLYTRSETYFVVEGINNEEQNVFVFVPKENGEITTINANEGLTADEAQSTFATRVAYDRILSVQIGLENQTPIWEIVFINENNQLAYYYLDFVTGEYLGIRVLP